MKLADQLLSASDRSAVRQVLDGSSPEDVQAAAEAIAATVLRHLRANPLDAAKPVERIELVAEVAGDPVVAARARWLKGHVLAASSRPVDALAAYEDAAERYRVLGRKSEIARIATGRVNCLTYLGRYREAIEVGEAARAELRRGPPAAAAAMELNLGNIYHRIETPSRALAYYDRALALAKRSDADSLRRRAELNRGVVYSALGRFDRAEKLLESVGEEAASGGEERIRALVDWNLGYIRFQKGEYGRAYDTLDSARAVFERFDDRTYLTHTLIDLTELLLEVNNFTKATDLGARARASAERLGLRFELGRATLFESMAALGRGDDTEAERLLEKASAIFREEGNASSEAVCRVYGAELALRSGDPGEAARLLRRAVSTFRREKMRLHEGTALLALVSADIERRRLAAAGKGLEEAARVLRRVASPWLKARLAHLRGRLAEARGELGAAIRHYKRAIARIESIRGRIGIDEFRVSFAEDKAPVYADLVNAILAHGKPNAVAEAFSAVERARSRALVDLLAVRIGPAVSSADPGAAKLLERLGRLRAEINRLSGFARPAPGERASFRRGAGNVARVREREEEMTELMRRLERRHAHLGALTNGETITLRDAQATLPEGTTLVEYYLGERSSYAFLIGRDEARVERLPIGRSEVQRRMLQFRFQIDKGSYGEDYAAARSGLLEKAVDRHLRHLSAKLWDPLDISEGSVTVIPHGPLHSLPFAALPTASGHVLDRWRISYLPSASCRRYLKARPPSANGKRRAPRILAVEAGDESIPEVRREVEEVRSVFRAGKTLLRDQATRQRFARAARDADVIHIATHGLFRGDDPSFSSLRLADGWMSLHDVYGLELEADLVVLSACQSGRNWVGPGDELVGLSRGFLYAGASSLLVSLWPVNDRSTASLMTSLYRELARGVPADEALASAMRATRDTNAHPYYWAPFVLIGGAGQRLRGVA